MGSPACHEVKNFCCPFAIPGILITMHVPLTREISEHFREKTGNGQLTPVSRLLAGAGAGIIAMSATYPLDMVRGRLTVQEGKTGQYKGIVHAARVIISEVRGRYRNATSIESCMFSRYKSPGFGYHLRHSNASKLNDPMTSCIQTGGSQSSVQGLVAKCHWSHPLCGAELCSL